MKTPKAAVCIIGNEILSGKVLDTNTHTIAQLMFRNGVEMVRTETVPDKVEAIAVSLRRLVQLVGPDGYVFTSGGIGPTHDDVTYKGVANAFSTDIQLHQPTYDAMVASFAEKGKSTEVNSARARMATLPTGCEILPIDSWVPFVVMQNVYVLPGIPSILKKMLYTHQDRFKGSPYFRKYIVTDKMEGDIASDLQSLQRKYLMISIGSYVNTGKTKESYNVKVSIEGKCEEMVSEAALSLIDLIDGTLHEQD